MEVVLEWVIHVGSHSSYGVIILLILLTGMGLPCPEDVILLGAGYLVYRGDANLAGMIAVALSSVLAGDMIMYGLGYRYGQDVLRMPWIRTLVKPARARRIEAFYAKHGRKTIFFGRFAAGIRSGIYLLAGTMKMDALMFFSMDFLAAILSVPLLIWAGMFFGPQIREGLMIVSEIKHILIVLAVGTAVILFLRSRKKSREGAPDKDLEEGTV